MQQCTLLDFMDEMKPWLDKDYIYSAFIEEDGLFVLQFLDGTRNIYSIEDCNRQQIQEILKDLQARGIKTPGL